MKTKWLVGAGLVLVVALLVWANLRQATDARTATTAGPKDAPLVKVSPVKARDLTQTVLAPGTLEATGAQEIRAPFTTQRVHLLVGLGDTVTQGQVLAELESEDLKVQIANQEAAVARAASAVAQLQQQRQNAPLQLSQKLEGARSQLIQAQAALQTALRQGTTARQRVEQAEAALLAIQNRSDRGADGVTQARLKLESAAPSAVDAARKAYDEAVRRATDEARQTAADLSQARQALEVAQEDLQTTGDDSAAVRQARAQVETARLAVEGAQRDAEAGGVLSEQMHSAESDLMAAQVALESDRTKLAREKLKAPAAGVVLSLSLKDSQPANLGQLLLELGDLQSLTVRTRVDEVDVGKLQPGQSLSVKSNAFPQERFAGKVTRVAAQAAGADGRTAQTGGVVYEIRGEVANNAGKLRAGMSVESRMTTDSRSKALVVGLESVREEGDKAFVLVARDFKVDVRRWPSRWSVDRCVRPAALQVQTGPSVEGVWRSGRGADRCRRQLPV